MKKRRRKRTPGEVVLIASMRFLLAILIASVLSILLHAAGFPEPLEFAICMGIFLAGGYAGWLVIDRYL